MDCRTIREQNITADILDEKKILAQFHTLVTLDECEEWLLNLINTYAGCINMRNSNIDAEFIRRITDFIGNHIEADISLNSVASEFHLSPNYLSKIFREGTGICFSDFVQDRKLQKAKELLLAESKKRIPDIEAQVGYYNTPHFINIFKEKYGMTPSMMRKSQAM